MDKKPFSQKITSMFAYGCKWYDAMRRECVKGGEKCQRVEGAYESRKLFEFAEFFLEFGRKAHF